MLIDLERDSPTQEQIGAIVGITQPTVSRLQAEGKIPSTGTLGSIIQAYCARLRAQAAGRGSDGPLDLGQERAALAREQRESVALKNAIARREFAPVTLLAQVLATASQAVAERFDHLPGVLRKQCPDLTSDDIDAVVAVIAQARNEWVRATAELAQATIVQTDDELEPELDGMGDEPRAV